MIHPVEIVMILVLGRQHAKYPTKYLEVCKLAASLQLDFDRYIPCMDPFQRFLYANIKYVKKDIFKYKKNISYIQKGHYCKDECKPEMVVRSCAVHLFKPFSNKFVKGILFWTKRLAWILSQQRDHCTWQIVMETRTTECPGELLQNLRSNLKQKYIFLNTRLLGTS